MFKEFKEFALRGNVVDMAVGIIIGAAFGSIVTSFVNDILMPPVGLLMGGMDFSNLFINLSEGEYASLAEAQAAGAATINYGLFINALIDFLLIALALFLLIKWINKLRREPEAVAETALKDCPYCYTSIAEQASRCPNCTSELSGAGR